MTIHNPDKFRQWLPAMFDGQFHWEFLNPAFKETKIQPMDYDAVVERRGHRLIMETKTDGKDIPVGQCITLTNEWKLNATILHIEGKTPETISGYALYPEGGYHVDVKIGDKQTKPARWEDILYVVRCWFCCASDEDVPTRQEWDTEFWLWDYDRNLK